MPPASAESGAIITPAVASERTWRADLELLEGYHGRLLAAIARTSDTGLRRRRARNRRTIAQELMGMALHDTYHAGQIRLIAKLGERRPRAKTSPKRAV